MCTGLSCGYKSVVSQALVLFDNAPPLLSAFQVQEGGKTHDLHKFADATTWPTQLLTPLADDPHESIHWKTLQTHYANVIKTLGARKKQRREHIKHFIKINH